MELDFSQLEDVECYRLITGLVAPRPIAWVTTASVEGMVNAAPFSFFNVLGVDPVIVALGIGDRKDGAPKDSARNIAETGEFVVNLASEPLAAQMVQTAFEFPPDVDELASLGLKTEPSRRVAPPRIAGAPASLECRLVQTVEIGKNRILLGEVVHAAIADDYYDAEARLPRTAAMKLIGRMHGSDQYTRTRELFSMARPKADDLRTPGGSLDRIEEASSE